MLKLGSWSALALEFSLGVLIWVRDFRYVLLSMGLLFHLWLEYSLNIPLFQWDILSAYVLFVDPDEMVRLWRRFVPFAHELRTQDAPAQTARGLDG